MFGNEIYIISHDAVLATRVASLGPFGAHDVHLHRLAYVRFRKQAARIGAAEDRPSMLVCCRRKIIQTDLMNFLFYTVGDIPYTGNSGGAEQENHNQKD